MENNNSYLGDCRSFSQLYVRCLTTFSSYLTAYILMPMLYIKLTNIYGWCSMLFILYVQSRLEYSIICHMIIDVEVLLQVCYILFAPCRPTRYHNHYMTMKPYYPIFNITYNFFLLETHG